MLLVDFLLARVAEDEGTALYAQTRDDVQPEDWGGWWFGHHQHYSRHDPTRVVADCEAKRRIVEEFEQVHADYQVAHTPTLEGQRFGLLKALSFLALPYADHPDYREEWKP